MESVDRINFVAVALSARFLIGVGEAAYASVGMAILISMFPARRTSTVAGAFMAGSMVGSVMGIGFGGSLASHFGWRTAFVGMAVFGIALTLLYMTVASPARIEGEKGQSTGIKQTESLATVRVAHVFRDLFSSPVLICVYIVVTFSGCCFFNCSAQGPGAFTRYTMLRAARTSNVLK